MKRKYVILRKQFNDNNIEFKKASAEWILEHILSQNKECNNIASILSITITCAEGEVSAVKRIKSRKRSTMKNELLTALIHISLNGSPIHSKEVDIILNNVTNTSVSKRHYKVPKLFYEGKISSSTNTQTDTIKFLSYSIESSIEISRFEYDLQMINQNDFLSINLESDDSSSEDEEDNNYNKEESPI